MHDEGCPMGECEPLAKVKDWRKTPFPWFGGKADAAEHVWAALGDVAHYVEPFMGSCAVLLRRPHACNRTYYSETVNDADGLLCNFWRAVQRDPNGVAEAASWPVSEADLHARHVALLRWKNEQPLERLMGDPSFCDVEKAGWWAWGQSAWIGSGWCSGEGPWWVSDEGIFYKRERPKRGTKAEPGVSRQLPHLGDDGQGANRPQMREPGVSRQLPHLVSNGQGANRPQMREPGVSRKLPHLGDDGQGANRPQMREPGVSRKLPHLGDDGRGANRPQMREPGVGCEPEFHPMTMPELRRWIALLSARLRHVRILHGDWARTCTTGAALTLPVRQGKSPAGVFLDPPYSRDERADVYSHEADVTEAVRAWCLENGADKRFRIVLAGYADEGHEPLEAAGWRAVEWYKGGFLKGGMGNVGGSGKHQQHRERLWLSPHCIMPEPEDEPKDDRQSELF